MTTAGTVAAIVAAVASVVTLALGFWWRRPSIELLFSADAAEGSGTKVFTVSVYNVGSTPVRIRAVVLLIDGAAVDGRHDKVVIVTPQNKRVFRPSIPTAMFEEIESRGSKLAVRVSYDLRRTAEVQRGERKTFG